MTTNQQLSDETPLRRFEYDDGVVLAADVGPEDTSVDVVGGKMILVAGDEQYEHALPDASDARAFMNNGVLTIELSAEEEH